MKNEKFENPLLDVDSYKSSHWLQYPHGTTSMFNYVESRGGKHRETIFFGLQYYIKRYLTQRIRERDVDEATVFFKMHGMPFNYDGWMYVARKLNGRLPVRIRAVPEGSVVPNQNALFTVESTDPNAFWVVSWLETMLLRVWYTINVATLSYSIKQVIKRALERSSDDWENEIMFKLHDFGCRGVSSRESAALGGAAHLVNFAGSDTVPGIVLANSYYDAKMAAFSIPASEHSSITSWGRDNEEAAYANMIARFAKPGSVFACVSDSYDLWNAIDNLLGEKLRRNVCDSGATLVVRPDSGDPITIVSKAVQHLDAKFGSKTNSKGFRVLNNVRVIQGDGINDESVGDILSLLMACGYSATNVAFGMGGALLQCHNRDTNKFAMKCSSITVNNVETDVFKDPVTDKNKKSKAGRLDLVNDGDSYRTVRLENGAVEADNTAMVTVYENGAVRHTWTLDEIRARVDKK